MSFIRCPEPRKYAEVNRLLEGKNKSWLKATLKQIMNLINNQKVLVQDSEKGEPINPCIDVHKAKIQSDESLEKLKLIFVVGVDL